MSTASEAAQVASIAVVREGRLLFLRRRDNGKWTLPGGHLDAGEEPLHGAARELLEETGLAGRLEYIGDGLSPRGLEVFAFRVELEDGEPHAGNDPDAEAAEFAWFAPGEIPPDEELAIPRSVNVTLRFLGLSDDEHDDLQKREPAVKEWRSPDGLKIPHHTSPERVKWDKDYKKRVTEVFGYGDPTRLKKVKVQIDNPHLLSGHYVQGAVGGGGRDRRKFYTRMLSGGDRLPPLIVRRNGLGWHIIDGNARVFAGQQKKVSHLDAYELVDPPMKKDEPKNSQGIKALGPGGEWKGPAVPSPEGLPNHKNTRRLQLKAEAIRDYSHLLSPILRKQYVIRTTHGVGEFGRGHAVMAKVFHKDGTSVGNVTGYHEPGEGLFVQSADVKEHYRGKGFGKALYAALFAHSYHHLGARKVIGEDHSSMAHRVHQSLAEKYGLQYEAPKQGRETGPMDDAYGPYEYALKQELDVVGGT